MPSKEFSANRKRSSHSLPKYISALSDYLQRAPALNAHHFSRFGYPIPCRRLIKQDIGEMLPEGRGRGILCPKSEMQIHRDL
jgi:hypothetical protein